MNASRASAIPYRVAPTLENAKLGEVTIAAVTRFVRWMDSRRTPVRMEDVRDHFNVSRATAYRWLRGYEIARGLDDAR